LSKWTGKYVIGLTGNIGTGKSVVRRMLEHLGAYGIDADALGHRAIAKGAPGYLPVLETFGRWIIGADEQIDRGKLGRIVFNDPDALSLLEHIVHPFVDLSIDILIRRVPHNVIVIEAIKLLEANLQKYCDSIWVTFAPPKIQLARLIGNRKMTEVEARQRITSQSPQARKISAANVIIKNTGSFDDTWTQVVAGWKAHVEVFIPLENPKIEKTVNIGEMTIQRAGPRQSAEIAQFINKMQNKQSYRQEDVMASFGEKAFLLLRSDSSIKGYIGWQVENLISRTTEILLDPFISPNQALPILISEMEKASRDLQCEASLVIVPNPLAKLETIWSALGYEQRLPINLGVLAWQEAALETTSSETTLFFKQLRQERILRPI
jgi:dephospho-CoA kinase